MTRYCIVRDLVGNNNATAPMACSEAIKVAKSGKWGKSWSLEECLTNHDGSAPILKQCIQFKDGKYNFMSEDDFFASHFK